MAKARGVITRDDPPGMTAGLIGNLPVAEAARAVEEGRVHLEDDRPRFSRDVESLLAALDVGSLAELHRLVERGRPDERLPLIGRDRALLTGLAKLLHKEARRHHPHKPVCETRRGATFELRLFVENEDTGRVARVTVELDRVEPFPGSSSR